MLFSLLHRLGQEDLDVAKDLKLGVAVFLLDLRLDLRWRLRLHEAALLTHELVLLRLEGVE